MCRIVTLKIRDFGPISDAEFTIGKITVLIGNQGSGKSTVAKLFSLFTWLEKALIRGVYSEKQLRQGKFRNKSFVQYHRIEDYFRETSFISYSGLHYNFEYTDGSFRIESVDDKDIKVSKVMYMPAERNIISALDNPLVMNGWPKSLNSFITEYESAKFRLQELSLPLSGNKVTYRYDRLNKISWIEGPGYKVRLTDASSGYQSVVPICLVTRYLTDLVQTNANEELSLADWQKLRSRVHEVMSNTNYSDDVKNVMLQNISSQFGYSGFVSVVEEMEQNLYPSSQKDVLYFLLAQCNRLDANRLFLTTHSPYLLSYLSLATKACGIMRGAGVKNSIRAVETIVPQDSCVDINDVYIYELTSDGGAVRLESVGDIPSDDNLLNNLLEDTNNMFNDLLDAEELCQA